MELVARLGKILVLWVAVLLFQALHQLAAVMVAQVQMRRQLVALAVAAPPPPQLLERVLQIKDLAVAQPLPWLLEAAVAAQVLLV